MLSNNIALKAPHKDNIYLNQSSIHLTTVNIFTRCLKYEEGSEGNEKGYKIRAQNIGFMKWLETM